jgi:Tol biopolymer transport system component
VNRSQPSRFGASLPLALIAAVLLTCFGPVYARFDDPPTTVRVSVAANGTQAGGPSNYPAISADGRFVAFASDAANLITGDTNGAGDIFVKDCSSGAVTCVSLSMSGIPGQGESYAASISADGQHIAFVSEGPDLVTGDGNSLPDVFVRDLANGTTTRLSVPESGGEADGASTAPRISADGRFVAFVSSATNLAAGDSNGSPDIFVRDLQASTLEWVSVSAAGGPSDGACDGPALSADGRYVAFASNARNLIAGESGDSVDQAWDVYRRDRQTGTTVRVSASLSGGKGDGQSFAAAISADGRYVAFASMATNLISSDLNGKSDIYLRDLSAGTTLRVSIGPGGLEPAGESLRPSMSADGRFVAFESSAGNLVSEPAPEGSTWSYLRDLGTTTTIRVISASPAALPESGSLSPVVSSDGRWIAFSSAEPALVAGDSNEFEDVFARGPLH